MAVPTPVDLDERTLSPALAATIALEEVPRRDWDVLIAGAGPAGSMAALALARRGLSVLLVDKAAFPRFKVCGCCLSAGAVAQLEAAGLYNLPWRLGAQPLYELRLYAGRREAVLPLEGGCSLSREALDAALVKEAVAAGACFLPRTRAACGRSTTAGRGVELIQGPRQVSAQARVVLAADGLAGRFLEAQRGFARKTARRARIGAGVRVLAAPAGYDPGVVYMAVGLGGYVGSVRLEHGQLDVAATFDAEHVRAMGGPAPAAGVLLKQAGLPEIPELHWRGVPSLSHQRARMAGHRLFVIGDSAAYVEPFTGEGMAWALACGAAVADLAAEGAAGWRPVLADTWERMYHRLFGRRHWRCRVLTQMLRQEWLAQAGIAALGRMPKLARPFIRAVNTGPVQPPLWRPAPLT